MASALTLRAWALAWITRSMRGPATGPGRIAFERMPKAPSSAASVWLKPTTPHFEAA